MLLMDWKNRGYEPIGRMKINEEVDCTLWMDRKMVVQGYVINFLEMRVVLTLENMDLFMQQVLGVEDLLFNIDVFAKYLADDKHQFLRDIERTGVDYELVD
ncbi:MAG: hypothetical protein HUJ56_12805 [Erysipelotrichaceae bacterium]|nr:hypothetical protein [Erysipelotrichaceae bacterium]